MNRLTLAHDLLLLSLDPETGARRKRQRLGYALVGALLAELHDQGRVDLAGKNVVVTNPGPIGDSCADDLLRRIVADKPRTPKRWVEKQHRAYTQTLLDDLCRAEIVSRTEARLFGLFRNARYPQIGSVRRDELIRGLHQIVAPGMAPPASRSAVLAGLIGAVGLQGQTYPSTPRRELKRRVDSIDHPEWIPQAVRKAIEAAEAAAASA